MSVAAVREYLKQYGLEDRVIETEESSATVELAAKAVGTEPARIAKSMSFLVDGKPIIILLAGDVKTDNSKYKHTYHKKAAMIHPEQLQLLPEETAYSLLLTLLGFKPGKTNKN